MFVMLKVELDIVVVLVLFVSFGKDVMCNVWCCVLKKSVNWVKGQIVKYVLVEMYIVQKLVCQWFYFFLCSVDKGKVWFGFNVVEVYWLGNLC